MAVVGERGRAGFVPVAGDEHDDERSDCERCEEAAGEYEGARAPAIGDGRRLREAARGAGLCCGRTGTRSSAASVQRGVLREDRALELAQLLARLDAELLDERRARIAVRRERLRLPAGAVQREHQLGARPLAQRVGLDERLELPYPLGVVAQGELRLHELLGGGQPKLLQAGDLRLRERVVGEVGQRGAAPQREPLPEQLGRAVRHSVRKRRAALGEQALEARGVHLVRVDVDHVSALLRDDQTVGARAAARLERLAQPRDVHLEALRGRGRRMLVPELVDQPVARDELVGVKEQDRQDRPLL